MIFLQITADTQDFFKLGTFATLAGATGIVYIVCGGIQQVFNYKPKWLALLISIVVSFIGLAISHLDPKISDWVEYLIAFLNGFLIFMTATGTNQIAAPSPPNLPITPEAKSIQRLKARKFNTNWWDF